MTKDLKYHNKRVIQDIQNNNIIVYNKPTSIGNDALLSYIDDYTKTSLYIGWRVIYESNYIHSKKNINYLSTPNLDKIRGKRYDLIIIENKFTTKKLFDLLNELLLISEKIIVINIKDDVYFNFFNSELDINEYIFMQQKYITVLKRKTINSFFNNIKYKCINKIYNQSEDRIEKLKRILS